MKSLQWRASAAGLVLLVVAALGISLNTPARTASGTSLNAPGDHSPYAVGDVFAGIGNGLIRRLSPTGSVIETLNTGTGCSEDLGMAFDAQGNLYATAAFGGCSTGRVAKFNNQGGLIGPFGSGYSSSTESVALDIAGNVYVGQPDGTRDILKFAPDGTLLASYDVPTEGRGSDWIDLAADQCTMYYTSESTSILRYDVCTNAPLPNFATALGSTLYALRILPDGGVLVAADINVKRLDASGTVIGTYPKAAGETSFLFALNLDPDGVHFWTAGYGTGNVYKYAIEPVGQPVTTFNVQRAGCCLSGLAVFGERRAAQPTPTATGAASATSTATPRACTANFPDNRPGDTFYEYIQCLFCRGIVSGFSDGRFHAERNITRGQISKMVSNAAGFREDPGPQIYSDVPPGSAYYPFINRLTRRGIMSGYPCPQRPEGGEECTPENPGLFKPGENATRGQLAKIVSNAAGFNEAVSGQFYTDVPPTGERSVFYEWIMRLTNRGVMSGYACGTRPDEPCDSQNRPYFRWAEQVTRGQASKIVANTFFPNCEDFVAADGR